ncbi:MAG TPA: DoxX family protein [Verrucomicrobiae bacterium]|jgi:putative oxidoreductase|nr:DoxX family protein [Verrucomicrobiae bacterium]
MDFIFRTEPYWPMVVLRLGLAAVFFAHSAQQMGWFGGKGLGRTLNDWKEHHGIPVGLGAAGIVLEILGSCAIVLGFLTRPLALGLLIFIFIAMWKSHWQYGFFLAHRGGERNGVEFCLVLILMALALVIGGGGALSLDLMLAG